MTGQAECRRLEPHDMHGSCDGVPGFGTSKLYVRLRTANPYAREFHGVVTHVQAPHASKSCRGCAQAMPAGRPRWTTSSGLSFCCACVEGSGV